VTEPILSIEDLSVNYATAGGSVHALSHVSLEILPGRVTGIVGETGCGKSTLAHAIPGLLPVPAAQVRGGRIVYRGIDLTKLPRWKLPMVRGTGIGMIFQEPLNSLNPAFRIYDQVAEAIRIRRIRERGAGAAHPEGAPFDYSRPESPSTAATLTRPILPGGAVQEHLRARGLHDPSMHDEVIEALTLVRINDPETIVRLYPHELSGGMRQRVMIAQALSERPSLLIADEPTSALDVTIQAQVLTLMKELIDELHTSILFISHDLGVIAEIADNVGVLYAGRLVELGPVAEVFERPRHPYTRALLHAAPSRFKEEGPLDSIPGTVPNLARLPMGCVFHPRCAFTREKCPTDPAPPLRPIGTAGSGDHRTACWYAEEVT
jgi:peptide/nickel transport system ATP-binding protein